MQQYTSSLSDLKWITGSSAVSRDYSTTTSCTHASWFCNARIQTWFPFNIQICLNGRECLARQFEREGRADFKRVDNCFTWLGNPAMAQRRMDAQLETDWPHALDSFARTLNPLHRTLFESRPMS